MTEKKLFSFAQTTVSNPSMAVMQIHLQAPTLFAYGSMITIFFIFTIVISSSWPASPLSFNYTEFNESIVDLTGDAFIPSKSVQISSNEQFSAGWVTNKEQMHLWDKGSKRLTDFTTEFTFQIYQTNGHFGDGMTFFLADPRLKFDRSLAIQSNLGIPLDTPGTNQTSNSSKYQFVAVEFDTFPNEGIDPDYQHVGIDIKSIISSKTEPWNMSISDENEVYYARINYDSSTYNLGVTFDGSMTQGGLRSLSLQVDLRGLLPEWVIVGFSASTGGGTEMHILKSWSMSPILQIDGSSPSPTPTVAAPIPQPPPKKGSKIRLWLGLGIGLFFFFCFLGCVLFLRWKKVASQEEKEASQVEDEEFAFDPNLDEEFEKGIGPKRFSYNELVSATNDFAEAEKLGRGGFGSVYKGFLKDLNSFVAIKRISRESGQGIKEYAAEVKVISQLRHKNLVQLIGWCHEKNNLLLVYEFMPNGSLDFHLFNEHSFLTWQVRYNIAQDLASALLYLQELWKQCVLHRDIKSSNIMLDSNFNAMLGDFGLARLVDHAKGSQTTIVAGTIGYMASECILTGKATKESDIFSFGIVALEIACGRKSINLRAIEGQVRLVEWIWELYGKEKLLDAVDPKLCGEFDIQQMERLMVVGLWCAHPDSMLRPSIRQAIHVLNFEAPLPVLPNKLPVPTYFLPPSTISSSSLSTIHLSQFTSSSTSSTSVALPHTI